MLSQASLERLTCHLVWESNAKICESVVATHLTRTECSHASAHRLEQGHEDETNASAKSVQTTSQLSYGATSQQIANYAMSSHQPIEPSIQIDTGKQSHTDATKRFRAIPARFLAFVGSASVSSRTGTYLPTLASGPAHTRNSWSPNHLQTQAVTKHGRISTTQTSNALPE